MAESFNEYNQKVMKRFLKPKNFGKLKNPDSVGSMGNQKCLLPEEKIFLNDEFKEINETQKGDFVISQDSSLNRVKEKFSRNYKGKIISIKNCMGSISLTSDHLIYAIKVPKEDKFLRIKNKQKLIPAWFHAEDLDKGDITLYPTKNIIEDVKDIKLDINKSKWDFRSKNLPKKICLDKDFLRLCGYFLAEGHISEEKSKNYITIAFNTNEKEYAEDVKNIVKKIFNLDVPFRIQEKSLVVMIYSANLARFFKRLFNKGAKNKRIPDLFMKLPIKKQKYLIQGIWRGDGYVNVNRTGSRAGYVTISYQLAQQIKTLLLRQKIVPSIYVEKEKIVKGVNHKTAYRIHVGQRDSLIKLCKILEVKYSPRSYESISSWLDNNFLYIPITKTEKREYEGKVYNLEVENTHSFISEAFCLHNCGDIMEVNFKLDKTKKKIKDIKFQTWGCGAAIAASDALCELAKGKTLEEAKKITNKDIIKNLGGLPQVKLHCSVLGAGALHKAIENYEKNKDGKNK